MSREQMLGEASRYWRHGNAILEAESLDELKRLLADFFKHEAELIRDEVHKYDGE